MVSSDIDLSDPYDAAAMYECFLICEKCGVEPNVELPARYDLAHYRLLGQAAKSLGWFVAPREGEDASFHVLCAACTKLHGLTPDPDRRLAPTEVLLTIAALASGSPDDMTPNKSLERTRGK
jgi:hypothetical protein